MSDLASQSPATNPPLETSPLQAFSILTNMCICEKEGANVEQNHHLAERQEMGKNNPKT